MAFSPNNPVVQLCLQGMKIEDKGNPGQALQLFLQAWETASNDFDKFIAAHYVARLQDTVQDQLKWLKINLQFALKVNDAAVKPAFSSMYSNMAKCYKHLGDDGNREKYQDLAFAHKSSHVISDNGPFFHGTKAALKAGDLLVAKGKSNYKTDLVMNHIYFTALVNGAGLAASLAKGDKAPRVYIITPTGEFENDPNVTNKKFPKNPTRSYRSLEPLKIITEIKDFDKITPEQLQDWQQKLANNKGDIIN